MPFSLELLFVVLLGLALGSFTTMLTYRFPRGETWFGRSHCPQCGHALQWIDLIPILSFFMLGRRCRYCKQPIAWRYALIEVLVVILAILTWLHFRALPLAPFIFLATTLSMTLFIALVDSATQKIPDIFVMILLFSALLFRITDTTATAEDPVRDAVLGALIPFLFFGVMWLLSRGKWLGSGDIFFGAALGVLLGVELTVLALFLTYAVGAVVAILLLLTQRAHRGTLLPFGPFLASGAILALFVGDPFLEQYVWLFH